MKLVVERIEAEVRRKVLKSTTEKGEGIDIEEAPKERDGLNKRDLIASFSQEDIGYTVSTDDKGIWEQFRFLMNKICLQAYVICQTNELLLCFVHDDSSTPCVVDRDMTSPSSP